MKRYGRAGLRPHRQHRLRCRPRRLVRRGGLFGLQGRHDRLHQDDGARAGQQGHHPQHPVPGPDRYRNPAQLPRRARTAPSIAEGLKRAIPMRRLGSPEDYPGSGRHSCFPTTPPTSPARPSACPAVSPCTDERWTSTRTFSGGEECGRAHHHQPAGQYNAFTPNTCEELIDAFKKAGWDKRSRWWC